MTRVVILAAGMGTRLYPYTKDKPKCMVSLAEKSILFRQIEIFNKMGLHDISVVSGYKSEMIENSFKNLNVFKNDEYKNSNMVFSLLCALEKLNVDDDLIVSYGDIIFEDSIVEKLVNHSFDSVIQVIIDRDWKNLWNIRMGNPLADAETLKLNEFGNIIEIGKKPKSYLDIDGQYIGLFKINSKFIQEFKEKFLALLKKFNIGDEKEKIKNMYMTDFLQYLIDSNCVINAIPINGGWLEIDSKKDLDLYHKLFYLNKLWKYCNIL